MKNNLKTLLLLVAFLSFISTKAENSVNYVGGEVDIVVTAKVTDCPDNSEVIGQEVIYTYSVVNTGTVPINTIVITDAEFSTDITAELTLTGDANDDLVLDLDETWVFTAPDYIIAEQDVDIGEVISSAFVTANVVANGDEVQDSDNNNIVLENYTSNPAINLVQSAEVSGEVCEGNAVTYSCVVTIPEAPNAVALYNILISSSLLGEDITDDLVLTGDDNGDTILQPDEIWVFTAPDYIITPENLANGEFVNSALVTANDVINNLEVQDSDAYTLMESASCSPNSLAIDLSITAEIVNNQGCFNSEGEIIYQFIVNNTGSLPITNLVLTSDILEGDITASSTLTGDVNADSILNSNETWVFTAPNYAVTDFYEIIENNARIEGDDLNGVNSANDTAVNVIDYENPDFNFTYCAPGINIEKSAVYNANQTVCLPEVNDTVTYSFTVTNTGGGNGIVNITVIDAMLGGDISNSYVSGDANNDNLLNSSETWLFLPEDYTVTQADVQLGVITNEVTVTGYSEIDVISVGDTDFNTIDFELININCEIENSIEIAACVANDTQAYTNQWNLDNIALLQACAGENVTISSDYNFSNFVAACANTGDISVVYTLENECGNFFETEASLSIQDNNGPDLVNCNLQPLAIDNCLTNIELETLANNWNNNNITTLQNCAFDSCNPNSEITVQSDFNFSNLTGNCVFGGEDLLVVYTLTDACGMQEMYDVSIYFTPTLQSNTITGTSTLDLDNNGCNVNDPVFPFIKINMNNGTETGVAFTNNSGVYSMNVPAGNYTLTPELENPTFFNVTPEEAIVNISTVNGTTEIQDFCITANGVINDLEVVIAPFTPAVPGSDAEYLITYKNKGNQTVSGEVNFFYNDEVLDFVSTTQETSAQESGSLTWEYLNLMPFESRTVYVTLNVNDTVDTPAVNVGDELVFSATVNPVIADELAEDNTFQFNQLVLESYYPYNLICIEGETEASNQIGEYLHYIVNFTNTTNEPIENVAITIEFNQDQFDIDTIMLLSSTHNTTISIVDGVLRISFLVINLDSGGHGGVLLKIKTREDIGEDNSVENTAFLFLDNNLPIVSNRAETTFVSNLTVNKFLKDKTINIFPNPVSKTLTVSAKDIIKNISIFDIQGRELYSENLNGNKLELNMSSRAKGVYFVKIKTDKGIEIKKIIKN